MAPHKIWTRGEKGPYFLALFGLYAINQYFLVTLFPHRVNLPAHSNFSIRSHTVITTYCSVKKLTLQTFNDISQLIVYCAVRPSAAKLSAFCSAVRPSAAKVSEVQLDRLQLEANKIGP